ncbi:MAG TPA: hypothetical protein VML19_20610 [Verrucomicrobiae bacterium]|nr:hypothetical protein [Verrucomicrobiae bacterium]
MDACGTCHRSLTPRAPAPLFEIRRGYRAEWNGLTFNVETDSGDWTLRVRDLADTKTLYTARRSQARAAQLAAAEFAVFRTLGGDAPVNPERLARDLAWQEYW